MSSHMRAVFKKRLIALKEYSMCLQLGCRSSAPYQDSPIIEFLFQLRSVVPLTVGSRRRDYGDRDFSLVSFFLQKYRMMKKVLIGKFLLRPFASRCEGRLMRCPAVPHVIKLSVGNLCDGISFKGFRTFLTSFLTYITLITVLCLNSSLFTSHA